jgi:hypothetical protein
MAFPCESLSAADLIDLVAYLKSLQGALDQGGSGEQHKQQKHPVPPEGGHRSKH